MAVIVDAAEYFSRVKAALAQARHSALLIGWDFDTRVALEREGQDEGSPTHNELGRFITQILRENPSLRVYVLRWDLAFLKMPLRGTSSFFLLDLMGSRRLHFRLDGVHPPGACHHQKIVVIDDRIAFCGGIDITVDRWDTPEHLDDDPRRLRPSGRPHGPWHDVTTAVSGEAARALGDLARDRWFAASGERLEPATGGDVRWPESLEPDFRDVEVAIARTEPAHGEREAVREIEALYLAAIRSARRTIYIESQYFSGYRIAEAIAERLREAGGPEVVIVNPRSAQGWLEEEVMGSARALLLERLREADRERRLRIFTPVTAAGGDIYVHAKVVVVDDRLLRVGSSNVNNRSMGLDTECDLAVEATGEDPRSLEMRATITGIRDRLLGEHLGTVPEELARAIEAADGSLVRAVDGLLRPPGRGRTLVPFEPPALNAAERRLAESRALDPDHPEDMARAFRRSLTLAPKMMTAAGAAAGLAALAGTVLGLRRLRRGARTRAGG